MGAAFRALARHCKTHQAISVQLLSFEIVPAIPAPLSPGLVDYKMLQLSGAGPSIESGPYMVCLLFLPLAFDSKRGPVARYF